jgi:predicted nucleic acid-binding protein
MIIVSNTSPLCYLTIIGHAEILPKLCGKVHITQKVLEELRHPEAPPSVRNWATTPPDWLKVHSDPPEPDKSLESLDPGERTALWLPE